MKHRVWFLKTYLYCEFPQIPKDFLTYFKETRLAELYVKIDSFEGPRDTQVNTTFRKPIF